MTCSSPERCPWATVRGAGVLLVAIAAVIHPLRVRTQAGRHAVLGLSEPPGRQVAQASQFGFVTASGTAYRTVPGRPVTSIEDLPSKAMTLVLGGFRGPYAVWLWMQSQEEKEAGHHFDLVDRYAKIAALQPDYAQVWEYLIWEMAWNISVQWHSLEHKYQWIRRAIEFGEDGHRKNPRDATIMAALGRVYNDKLGLAQEAPYYRERMREDEDRSTFLVAYEWYDRARRANDLYGTLTGALTDTVVYSQACHAVNNYATELTLRAYGQLEAAAHLKADSKEEAARASLGEGLSELTEAIQAWGWAQREWRDHLVRWEAEGIPPALEEAYRRFYGNAGRAALELNRFQETLSYDELARFLAAARTGDAYAALEKAMEDLGGRRPGSARTEFDRAMPLLEAAVAAWETAVAAWDKVRADADARGAGDAVLAVYERAAEEDAAYLASLKAFRNDLTFESLPRYYAARLTRRALEAASDASQLLRAGRKKDGLQVLAVTRSRLTEALEAWVLAQQVWLAMKRAAETGEAAASEITQLQVRIDEASTFAVALQQLMADLGPNTVASFSDQIPILPVRWPLPPVEWPARDLSL